MPFYVQTYLADKTSLQGHKKGDLESFIKTKTSNLDL